MSENNLFPMNLQLFAEETGETTTNQEELPGDKEDTTAGTVEDKTFKQEDVNNIVAKESKKATEKLLKELGIDDFDNAKDGLAKFKEWQDSQKTEQEKQKEDMENLEKDKTSLSNENTSLKAQLAALKQGVNGESVEDVVALAERLVSDDVAIDEAIKQVVEKYPHFAGQEDEEDRPFFTTKNQTKPGKVDDDPFLAKIAKYN